MRKLSERLSCLLKVTQWMSPSPKAWRPTPLSCDHFINFPPLPLQPWPEDKHLVWGPTNSVPPLRMQVPWASLCLPALHSRLECCHFFQWLLSNSLLVGMLSDSTVCETNWGWAFFQMRAVGLDSTAHVVLLNISSMIKTLLNVTNPWGIY